MKNVNINASRLFGFVITEMKNSSLEKIMPEMYARHHSRLVETALIRIENHSN